MTPSSSLHRRSLSNVTQGANPVSFSDYVEPGDTLKTWATLSVTTLGAFMAALDSNIVALALPRIALSLSSGVSLLGWVIGGYILATATFLLQAGRIGDRYGRKSIYLSGFALFGAASALCGASQNIAELILFRVLQGVGAAILQASGTPLIFETFPPRLRGTAIGINTTTWAIGAVMGPVLGGFLVALDWRLIFYVNVPVAVAAILVGTRVIPRRRPLSSSSVKDFNPLNSALLGITVAMVLLWMTLLDARYAFVGLGAFILLMLSERRSSNPIVNAELRKNKGFVYSAIVLGVSQIAYLGFPFGLSLYFQSVAGFASNIAGLFIAPLSMALVLSNPLGGRLFDKMKHPAYLTLFGAVLDGASVTALALLIRAGTPTYSASLLLVAVGLGQGLVWAPMISTLLKFANPELRGLATGSALTLVNTGYAASIALVIAVSALSLPHSAVLQIYFGSLGSLDTTLAGLFKLGLANGLSVLGLINFLLIPLVLLVLREQRRHF